MNKFKEISIVEDDNVQIFLLRKYIEKTNLAESVTFFINGKEAYDEMEERAQKKNHFRI